MQIPPYLIRLPRNTRRVPAEAVKYVRNEFGDKDPSWLLARVSDNGHAKERVESGKANLSESIAHQLPSPVPMRDGCGADH